MNYPGKELELFDKASYWRKYLYLLIRKYIGENILEVGAGIGSFTNIYYGENKDITLSEIDDFNLQTLKKKFTNKKNIKVLKNFTEQIDTTFDTILYLSVLEHIEEDIKEINNAIAKLKDNGFLIICVPAHNYMFSNFDREIGHFRRYDPSFFSSLKFKEASMKKSFLIDSCGYFLYFFNKLFFKKEVYPTKLKIFIWDKIFVPISYIVDFFLFYKIGKNIICIIQKKNHNFFARK